MNWSTSRSLFHRILGTIEKPRRRNHNFRPALECLEERQVPSITWSGAVSQEWSTAGNWVGGVVPGATDDVVLDHPANANWPNITTNVTINSIIDDNTFTGPLNIYSSGSLTLTGGTSNIQWGNISLEADNVAGGGALNVMGSSLGLFTDLKTFIISGHQFAPNAVINVSNQGSLGFYGGMSSITNCTVNIGGQPTSGTDHTGNLYVSDSSNNKRLTGEVSCTNTLLNVNYDDPINHRGQFGTLTFANDGPTATSDTQGSLIATNNQPGAGCLIQCYGQVVIPTTASQVNHPLRIKGDIWARGNNGTVKVQANVKMQSVETQQDWDWYADGYGTFQVNAGNTLTMDGSTAGGVWITGHGTFSVANTAGGTQNYTINSSNSGVGQLKMDSSSILSLGSYTGVTQGYVILTCDTFNFAGARMDATYGNDGTNNNGSYVTAATTVFNGTNAVLYMHKTTPAADPTAGWVDQIVRGTTSYTNTADFSTVSDPNHTWTIGHDNNDETVTW
jgi:hypothetical protein